MDFYSHIGVSPSATLGEINKAYRKKSLALQCVYEQTFGLSVVSLC